MNAEVIQFPGPRRSCFNCESAMTGQLSGVFCDFYREYVEPSEARLCPHYTEGTCVQMIVKKSRKEAMANHPSATAHTDAPTEVRVTEQMLLDIEILPQDVEAYLMSRGASAWGRVFSLTKPDHREQAVDYLLQVIQGVQAAADERYVALYAEVGELVEHSSSIRGVFGAS